MKRRKLTTIASPPPYIPTEIVTRILSWADGPTWVNARFVCRQWNFVCTRGRLFDTIAGEMIRVHRDVPGAAALIHSHDTIPLRKAYIASMYSISERLRDLANQERKRARRDECVLFLRNHGAPESVWKGILSASIYISSLTSSFIWIRYKTSKLELVQHPTGWVYSGRKRMYHYTDDGDHEARRISCSGVEIIEMTPYLLEYVKYMTRNERETMGDGCVFE